MTDSLIGIINNESTKDWKQFKVSLPTCVSQFQIVVEGVRGIRLIKNNKNRNIFDSFSKQKRGFK